MPRVAVPALDGVAADVLACLYTRHHDGFVRQRHLRRVVRLKQAWVVPFVVQLIGEYVLEILLDIHSGLADLDAPGSEQRKLYGQFISENPDFLDLTRQRVLSYWDCYYRTDYPDRSAYPGWLLVMSLQRPASEYL